MWRRHDNINIYYFEDKIQQQQHNIYKSMVKIDSVVNSILIKNKKVST